MIFFISAMVLLFSMVKSLQIGRCALGKPRMIINSGIGRAVRSGSVPCNMNTARWSSGSSADISDLNTLNEIVLQPEEQELFEMFTTMIEDKKLGTTVRVAGGWVRDKLLGVRGKEDIDVALDNLSGVEFAKALSEWNERRGGEGIKFGVIQQNPDKSKHLETATATLGKYQIDFVNLRTEEYTDSRIPTIEIGTPQEDADRRDLTINSLFYNVNKREVEDFTGRGLEDLATGLAKTPLEALTTLKDDPLRALRAVRFSCRFDLTMAPDLVVACRDADVHEALRHKVSRERIFVETVQMMQHPTGAARAVLMLHDLDLIKHVLSLEPTYIAGTEADTDQEYFAPPCNSSGAAIILPCKEESMQATSISDIEKSYHLYGTCVATALTAYQMSSADSEGRTPDSLDEEATILRGLSNFAALTMRGSTMRCIKPTKQGRKQGARPTQPLNSLVLQRLKMRVRDIESIEAMHQAALVLVPMLRRIMQHRSDGNVLAQKETGVPLKHNGIGRLELGLALRASGSVRECALSLAVASLMVEALQPQVGDLPSLLSLLATSTFGETAVSQAGFRGNAIGGTPVERVLASIGGGPTAESIKGINDAAAALRDTVKVMALEHMHEEVPLLNGKDIKKVRDPPQPRFKSFQFLYSRDHIFVSNFLF